MDLLAPEEALELLAQAPVAHLGVIDDGRPYVTPMSFVLVGNSVAFRTVPGRKLDAIRENPEVCVEAAKFDPESGEWASVIITGTARETDDPETRTAVVAGLFDKYKDALGSPLSRGGLRPLTGLPFVVLVEIEEVTGMVSGGGFAHRTRPGRL
jgi:nitroimidazol reductase NimA-like FMN-containing flavoprotein (pyridoxamine 5'-phosphate oxidase superfamily)